MICIILSNILIDIDMILLTKIMLTYQLRIDLNIYFQVS